MKHAVGYEFLRQFCGEQALVHQPIACVGSVTRVTLVGDTLLVPATVAPQGVDLLGHLLFALKHEGTNLAILAQTLPQVGAQQRSEEHTSELQSQ